MTEHNVKNLNHVVSLLKNNRDSLIEFFTTNEFPLEVLQGGRDMNKSIYYYDFLKPNLSIKNQVLKNIVTCSYVTYMNYTIFVPKIHIYKHRDVLPTNEIYEKRHLHRKFYGDPTYLRIHFPITDCGNDCFMIYDKLKCTWNRGEVYVYDVHNCEHEFWNNSDKPFAVLLIDVLTGNDQ